MRKKTSKAGQLVEKKKSKEKPKGTGKGREAGYFKTGYDPRRNLKGSGPRSAALLREMVLDLFAEEIEAPDPTNPGVREKVSTIYYMLRRMALGKAPADHTELLGRGYGPLASVTRNESEIEEFIVENYELFTQGQIDRMLGGEDKKVVFAEMLKEAMRLKKKVAK
jgi:hypothetical protein